MKILTITSIYPTKEDPGLGAFVASQVDSIREAGHAVDVLFLDVRRTKRELVRGILEARRRAKNYALFHAHFGYNGIPAVLQKDVPSVVSFCGTDLTRPDLLRISRWVSKRADACIVKSERLGAALGHPSIIIPNGVDMKMFRPASRAEARRRLGLSPKKKYALFPADPRRPEKRFQLANEALSRASSEAGIALEPLIMHHRPRRSVPDYMNAADLMLLTSTHEGSPNVVKEALACDLPVVSTDVGDVQQLVAGIRQCRICRDTTADIAHGILSVLDETIRSNARSRVEHLSSESVADQVIGVYGDVLTKWGKP